MPRPVMFTRVLFPAAVAATLLFGAAQAFASSGAQTQARACHEDLCAQWCGGPAFCEPSGACICI